MKRTAELLLAVFASGFVAFTIGQCAAPSPQDVRQDAYEAERILRRNRNTLVQAQAQTDTITRRVIVADRAVLAQRDSLLAVLTFADSVLADSTATLVTLRVTLAEQVRQTRAYIVRTDSLQGAMRDLIAAHALERLAVNQTLIAADSAVNAWKAVAHAERRQGWRRFTQGAFVGGIVALVAVVVL